MSEIQYQDHITDAEKTHSTCQAEDYVKQAMVKYNRQQLGEAKKLLEQALDQHPDHIEAITLLIQIAQKHNNISDAIHYLKRLAASQPKNSNTWYELAQQHGKQQDYKEAFTAYKKALKHAPDNLTTYHQLIHLIDKISNTKQLIELLKQGLEYHPNNATLLYGLARLYRKQEHFESEMACIEHAIATKGITPDSQHVAYHELAHSADQCGRYDQAHYYFSLANSIYYLNIYKQSFDKQVYLDTMNEYTHHITTNVDNYVDKTEYKTVDNLHRPIFILGFSPHDCILPTHILSSHPSLMTVQGTSHIEQALRKAQELYPDIHSYGELIDTLSPDHIHICKEHYIQQISKGHHASWPKQLRILDNTYTNSMYIEFIHKLFPNAQFILMERTIPDALFSAFTSKHIPSLFTLHCKTLISAAEYYNAWIALTESCINHLPLQLTRIQTREYEQSIRNFTGRILHHIECEWHKTVTDTCIHTQEKYNNNNNSHTLNWQHYHYYMNEALSLVDCLDIHSVEE